MFKKFKKYYFLLLIGSFMVIAMSALIFVKNRPVRNADKVLTVLLNIPAEPIQSAYETMDTMIEHTVQNSQEPTVFSPDDTLIKNTYREMFGDMVSDTFIEDCIRLNNMAFLHDLAIQQGFTAKLQTLDISKTSQKDVLTFDAQILVSTSTEYEKQIPITGRIQFDDSGKICAIRIYGKEIYENFGEYLTNYCMEIAKIKPQSPWKLL